MLCMTANRSMNNNLKVPVIQQRSCKWLCIVSSVDNQGCTIEQTKIIKETHENQKHFFVLQVVNIHTAYDYKTET
jgi:hypothetical protein